MATKFSDIGKGPADLLNDDYTSKVTVKCKKPAGPIAVTIESERGSSGALSSKVGGKFVLAGLSVDKIQMTAAGGHALETSLVPAPGFKVSFKGSKTADVGVDYKSGTFCATGVLDVKDLSKISTSACLGLSSGVIFGGNALYNLKDGKTGPAGLAGYNVGASYSSGPLFASATTASKLSQVNLGLLYKVNDDLTLASSSAHTSEKPADVVAIGGAYKASFGLVKAKLGNDGTVSACLVKEVFPKVTLTASGSVKTSDTSAFTYGLGIVM